MLINLKLASGFVCPQRSSAIFDNAQLERKTFWHFLLVFFLNWSGMLESEGGATTSLLAHPPDFHNFQHPWVHKVCVPTPWHVDDVTEGSTQYAPMGAYLKSSLFGVSSQILIDDYGYFLGASFCCCWYIAGSTHHILQRQIERKFEPLGCFLGASFCDIINGS